MTEARGGEQRRLLRGSGPEARYRRTAENPHSELTPGGPQAALRDKEVMATREFLLRGRVDSDTLEAWIAAGWLRPRRNGAAHRFSEVDLARARLIRDLKDNMGVNDAGITAVLDLVDQVHGLRRTLQSLLAAICIESGTRRRWNNAPMRESVWLGRAGEEPDQVLAPRCGPGDSGLPG
jgi:chaperone modulatory protein CbpM